MPEKDPHLESFNAWATAIFRVVAFLAGLAIMYWQTVVEPNDRPLLIGAALCMMCVLPAGLIGHFLNGRGGGQ